jgi:hypothetical protein
MQKYLQNWVLLLMTLILSSIHGLDLISHKLQEKGAFGKCKGLYIGKDKDKFDVINNGIIDQRFKKDSVHLGK